MQQNQGYQSSRKCIIEGHRQKNVLQICCFKDCKIASRWACDECMKKNLHVHGINQELYLKDQQQFDEYLQRNMRNIKNSQQTPSLDSKCLILKLQQIQTDLYVLLKFLQNFEAEQLNNNIQLLSSARNNVELDFYQIQSEEIDQIVNITSQFVLTEWLERFEKFDHQIQQFAFTFKGLYKSTIESYQKRFQSSIKTISGNQNPQPNPYGSTQHAFSQQKAQVQPLGQSTSKIRLSENLKKQGESLKQIIPEVSQNDFQQITSNQFQAYQQQMQTNIQGNMISPQMLFQKQAQIIKRQHSQQSNDVQQPIQYQK